MTTTYSPELRAQWLEGVTFTKPLTRNGWTEITAYLADVSQGFNPLKLTGRNGEWTIERERTEGERKASRTPWQRYEPLSYQPMPLPTARAVAARELKGLPKPAPTIVHYSGGAPLRRVNPSHERFPSRDIMAEARARARNGQALQSLRAECELSIR